jgi:hypothetical protein
MQQPGRNAVIFDVSPQARPALLFLQRFPGLELHPVLVLGLDPSADGTRVSGVPVRYAGENPTRLLERFQADVIVMPQNDGCSPSQLAVLQKAITAGYPVQQLEVSVRSVAPHLAQEPAALLPAACRASGSGYNSS